MTLYTGIPKYLSLIWSCTVLTTTLGCVSEAQKRNHALTVVSLDRIEALTSEPAVSEQAFLSILDSADKMLEGMASEVGKAHHALGISAAAREADSGVAADVLPTQKREPLTDEQEERAQSRAVSALDHAQGEMRASLLSMRQVYEDHRRDLRKFAGIGLTAANITTDKLVGLPEYPPDIDDPKEVEEIHQAAQAEESGFQIGGFSTSWAGLMALLGPLLIALLTGGWGAAKGAALNRVVTSVQAAKYKALDPEGRKKLNEEMSKGNRRGVLDLVGMLVEGAVRRRT